MRIAIIADCHLNKALFKGVMDQKIPTLPFRTVDHMNAFEWIVTDLIENIKPDLTVIAGDVFDTYNPSNEVRAFFFKQIKRFRDAKLPIIILVGNHDVCRRNHALQGVEELAGKNVKIIDDPKILSFEDHALLLFPYPMKVERKQKTMREMFHEFVKEFHSKKDDTLKDKEPLFFGHFPVQGATMGRFLYTKEESFTKSLRPIVNNDESNIGIAELDSIEASHIFLGDFHEHQRLKTKNSVAMYTGSIERTNIAEMYQEKGYVLYDSDAEPQRKMGKCKFIQYPHCRPMIDLVGNYKEIESAYSLHSESYEGAIVRISFVGDNKELIEFSKNLDDLKERILRDINPIHIYHTQKVKDEQEEQEASEIEQEIIERGHINSTDVLSVVSEMIDEKVEDKLERGILMSIAEDIYRETMEKE